MRESGDHVQRMLSGLPNHYEVSLHRMKALAYFCELHFWELQTGPQQGQNL